MTKRIGRLVILFWMVLLSSIPVNSFASTEQIPVIYNLIKAEQPDTLGYNIVNGMAASVYKGILEGKIKLWDSRKKEIQFLPATLKAIEKKSNVQFVDIENIFVYELWETKKKEVKIIPIGYEFVKKSENKVEVNFGFVEYYEAINVFKNSFIETNADGFSNLVVASILMRKQYVYNVIQFGSQVVKTKDESERIKKSAFDKNKYIGEAEAIRNDKTISFTITENHRLKDDKLLEKGNIFLNALEDYLNTNLSIYYRLKGIPFTDSLLTNPPKHFRVSKVLVTETWNKNGDYISFQPDSIVIFVGDAKLKTLAKEDFVKWDMVVDFMGMEDFLKEKKFFYVLTKINNQAIERTMTYKYQQALFNADWRQINKYVKESE